jgi:hypothetical protein
VLGYRKVEPLIDSELRLEAALTGIETRKKKTTINFISKIS